MISGWLGLALADNSICAVRSLVCVCSLDALGVCLCVSPVHVQIKCFICQRAGGALERASSRIVLYACLLGACGSDGRQDEDSDGMLMYMVYVGRATRQEWNIYNIAISRKVHCCTQKGTSLPFIDCKMHVLDTLHTHVSCVSGCVTKSKCC